MIEMVSQMTCTDEKKVEKIIQDENLHYLHMVFGKDEGLPEHFLNSTVYMTVLKGKLSLQLDQQEIHEYDAGTVLKIPFKTKMNVNNLHNGVLELLVVKAPAPGKF